jgi:hypothetical protein
MAYSVNMLILVLVLAALVVLLLSALVTLRDR